jgi:POLQ-like helicase
MSCIKEPPMKPEFESYRLLSNTQAKAKMYEFGVPMENHVDVPVSPARLFPLTIGILGDISARINDGNGTAEEIQELQNNLPFSARFFDVFAETKLNQENDQYLHLMGAAAYYLCNLPGSANILAERIANHELDLGGLGLENLLTWLLLIKDFPTTFPKVPNSPYRGLIESIHRLFLQFNTTGLQEDDILAGTIKLRELTYKIGTPRQLLLTDLIGAVIRKRFDNSTWKCLPVYTGLPVSEWTSIIKKGTFIKEFWPAQHLLGKKGVFRGKSAVVQMPTSAGKTKATEIIIRSAFIAKRTSLTVIIAPFRALCHEIRQGLLRTFQGEDIFVDELSDVLQKDYSVERILRDQNVLVATPEKFNYVLRHEPDLAKKIGLIIYDEGHQFDNGTRGITYELLLTSLKARIQVTTQTILISAVISNASQIGKWLIGDTAEIIEGLELTPTFRSIAFSTTADPRRNLYFVNRHNLDEWEFFVPRIIEQYKIDEKTVFPNITKGREVALFLGLKLAINKSAIAIFCGKKRDVTGMCNFIVNVFDKVPSLKSPLEFSNKTEVQKIKYLHDVNLGTDAITSKSAQFGIFAHHNNVPHGIRLAIEHAVKNGYAKFVICTSTLAQGVNLPIRYLIINQIDQGGETIKVRDFQNLIGRSGRSGMHTEGSILFADPKIYDQRFLNEYTIAQWQTVKTLLDPSQSEKCESKLYSIFSPLYGSTSEFNVPLFVKAYTAGTIPEIILEIQNQNLKDKKFKIEILEKQVNSKINIISAIESYLMANWDPAQNILDRDEIRALAKGTLAYFLANDEQKIQIEDLFILLAENIEINIPEIPQRVIFGRTLYGVPDSMIVSTWLNENSARLSESRTDVDMFEILWGLLQVCVRNKQFTKCDNPSAMKKIMTEWISGAPFYAMTEMLITEKAKRIAKSRRYQYTLEDVVDLCENGFAFDGILVIGAVIELIQSFPLKNVDSVVEMLKLYQKRLKYGLPSQTSIIFYELGFADRVVAIELSAVFQDVPENKELLLVALKARQEETFAVLNKYPAYFSQSYENVAL